MEKMRKFKFFFRVDSAEPVEEIAEYDYDVTDKEVRTDFLEWLFNQIDSAYWEIEDGDEDVL